MSLESEYQPSPFQSFMSKMSQSWTLKITVLLFMALLLAIPTFWIDDLIRDRRNYSREAQRSVETMWGGQQEIGTPVLGVPYQYECGNEKERKSCQSQLYVYPKELNIEADIKSKSRTKGIYEIPLYSSKVSMDFQLDLPSFNGVGNLQKIKWKEAKIFFRLENTTGLLSSPQLSWGKENANLTLNQGSESPFKNALSTTIQDVQTLVKAGKKFKLKFEINGSQFLSFAPTADENTVSMTSDWAHPEFIGFQLPAYREVNKSGFVAKWQISSINHLQPKQFEDGRCGCKKTVGFRQFVPVSHYTQLDRAIKYAKLFILFTFVFCFFTEVKSKRQVHIINYALVGSSLLIFFVLLLSLSEHIGFENAYWVASCAVVIQLGAFLWKVLKGTIAGRVAPLFILGLYAFLYFVLQSEDYALLAGSMGLFVILSGVMYLSAKMNWSNKNEK